MSATKQLYRVGDYQRRHLLDILEVEDACWGEWTGRDFKDHVRTPAHRIVVVEDVNTNRVRAFAAYVLGVGKLRVISAAGNGSALAAIRAELERRAGKPERVRWDCIGGPNRE